MLVFPLPVLTPFRFIMPFVVIIYESGKMRVCFKDDISAFTTIPTIGTA
jgi:hypothetical protein